MKVGKIEVELQGESDLVKVPADFDFDSMLLAAQELASNFTVAFVGDGKVIGSGTLVAVKGIRGILTAHHVSRIPFERDLKQFSLCIRDDAVHRLDVRPDQFQHIVIGNCRNKLEHTGPDLSFLMITDAPLAATLAGRKSFYPLFKQGDIHTYPKEKLSKMPWTISGSPAEFSTEAGAHKGEMLVRVCDLHVPVHFRKVRRKDNFDYLSFQIHSGVHEYPESYGGVSGGGIWLPAIQEMKNGEIEFPPTLQGVVFYESRPYWKGTRRLLIGHGPESIYKRVVEAL